jgi:hypothetical protein
VGTGLAVSGLGGRPHLFESSPTCHTFASVGLETGHVGWKIFARSHYCTTFEVEFYAEMHFMSLTFLHEGVNIHYLGI